MRLPQLVWWGLSFADWHLAGGRVPSDIGLSRIYSWFFQLGPLELRFWR